VHQYSSTSYSTGTKFSTCKIMKFEASNSEASKNYENRRRTTKADQGSREIPVLYLLVTSRKSLHGARATPPRGIP
jgi:hypothetical protein